MSRVDEAHRTRHIVVPYGIANASVRARAVHWVERLTSSKQIADDSVVVHGPGFDDRHVPPDSDLLLLRNARRLTRGRFEQQLMQRARLAVYDIDDGLPWDDGHLPGLGHWWKRPFPRSLTAARAAGAADRVIVGNSVLADWAQSKCSDVRVIPTCIEPADYVRRTTWDLQRPPTIGWIGSPATEHYLVDIADALELVHRRTGARLHIISGGSTIHPRLAEFGSSSAWTPRAPSAIADWDIGIMPLRDGAYERAKCGYKLLQYAASSVPAVGSPVGVNATLLAEMDGLAATTLTDWVEALETVIGESASRRGTRGAAGVAVAAEHSFDAWESRWLDAVGW